MSLLLQDRELTELMQDFHIVTGIRLALFDEHCNELLSYPAREDTLCACLRENPAFDCKCRESDAMAFDRCREKNALYVYRCHAGLTEATVPISDGDRVIGYMMFGQVTENKNRDEVLSQMRALCAQYGITGDAEARMRKLKYRNERQIRAAAKIMDACKEYVRLRELVQPSGRLLIDSIERFVESHIGEELDVGRICREFQISRTRLYEVMRPHLKRGVAAYIKEKRLEHAKRLIKTTDMTVAEVADAVGFADYNYFLRVFKKKYGVSSQKMKKQTENNTPTSTGAAPK